MIEKQEVESKSPHQDQTKKSKKVFIVHGHDGEVKYAVARFIEHLDLARELKAAGYSFDPKKVYS